MPTPKYTALATITLGSTASTVTFGSIPGTYRDLKVVIQASGISNDALVRFNSDTGANYTRTYMAGQGTSTATSASDSASYIPFAYVGTNPAALLLEVMDYSQTNKHKSTFSRGSDSAVVMAIAGRWASTAAITSMVIYPASGSWAAGNTFTLYGVK